MAIGEDLTKADNENSQLKPGFMATILTVLVEKALENIAKEKASAEVAEGIKQSRSRLLHLPKRK